VLVLAVEGLPELLEAHRALDVVAAVVAAAAPEQAAATAEEEVEGASDRLKREFLRAASDILAAAGAGSG